MTQAAASYALETRTCLCACGRAFKVLPSSPHRFYSLACQTAGVTILEADREESLAEMAANGFLTSTQVSELCGREKAWVVTQARRGLVPSVAVKRRLGSIIWIHRNDLPTVMAAANGPDHDA